MFIFFSGFNRISFLILLFILSFSTGNSTPRLTGTSDKSIRLFHNRSILPEFHFQRFGAEQGLLQQNVICILQDRRGFLWLGTDNGLVRYDGYRFHTLVNRVGDSTSLSHNQVNYLFEDKRGWLWVGTENGLNCFDPFTETFVRIRTIPSAYSNSNPNPINFILEDSTGNIWTANHIGISKILLGSEKPAGNSPSKLNVKKLPIIHFNPDKTASFHEKIMNTLLIDRRGNFWVGGNGGLFRMLPKLAGNPANSISPSGRFEKAYQRYPQDSLLLKGPVLNMLEDQNGVIWVKTANSLVRLESPDDSGSPIVRNLYSKSYWYGTGLYRAGALVEFSGENGNQLWLNLKKSGFTIFHPATETFQHISENSNGKKEATIPYFINTIYKDKTGVLWIGTELGGLFKLNDHTNRFSRFHPNLNSVIYNQLIDMRFAYEDSHGILWLANQGVYRCNRTTGEILSRFWTDIQADGWTFKNKIIEDGRGDVWIGSEFGGLFRFNQKLQRMETVINFALDGTDTLRILHIPDMRKVNLNKLLPGKHSAGRKLFLSENVTALARDNKGNIWTGIWADVTTASPKSKKNTSFMAVSYIDIQHKKIHFYPIKDLPAIDVQDMALYIYCIYPESPASIWLGTSVGLLSFSPQSGAVQAYQITSADQSDLKVNRIHAIAPDPRLPGKYLWVGTAGKGLLRFDLHSLEFTGQFLTDDGLAGSRVSSILSDEYGSLWLGTDGGLCHAHFDSVNGEISAFRTYTKADGLKDDKLGFFYGQNASKNSSGEMFFCGAKGLSVFRPGDLQEAPPPPPLVVTGFFLNSQPMPFRQTGSPLSAPILVTKEIRLNHQNHSFSLEMALLDFKAPARNRYAYKLEGYQDEWTYAGNDRKAAFTRVPPGKYIFRAMAANHNGIWNKEGVALSIIIQPPWYNTWWAYSLLVSLLFGLLYSIRRYEINRQRLKLQAETRRTEAEQLKNLDRLKTRFFNNISHEFRTPLALIKGPVEKELEQAGTPDTRNRMNMVLRNVNRLFHLINQLLDLGTLEARQMELRAAPGDLNGFLHGITMGFASWAERKNVSLKIFSKVDNLQTFFDRDLMEKIFNNLLSNAIKFTREGGKIEVTISTSGDGQYAVVKIQDNGIGIPADRLPHIFDRFYQADDSTTREFEGSGIGLALVKELVELHQGSIKVESREGTGTTFTLLFPLGTAHLTPQQMMASVTESKRVKPTSVDESRFVSHPTAPGQSPSSNPLSDRPLVLLVEDHADFRHFIREILSKDFRVIEATDGEKGLEIALEKIPDLVISDVMMPLLNGYELCGRLKNDRRTSHIPIILLTAKAGQEDRLEGLVTGADDYLSKPFDSRELQTRVHNLVEQRRKLQLYYQQHILLKTGGETVTSAGEQFLQQALDIVKENIDNEQFSVDDLAGGVGMSRSQLHRKLVALTGKSTSHFIRYVRLQHAAELLRNDAGNITEIAYMAGFGSQAYFTKCFTEQFGCSPSRYKQRNT